MRAGIFSRSRRSLSAYELQTALPTQEQGVKALWSKPTAEPIPDNWRRVMEDETLDPWDHSQQYANPGKRCNPDGYDTTYMGPDGRRITIDDIGNWKSGSLGHSLKSP